MSTIACRQARRRCGVGERMVDKGELGRYTSFRTVLAGDRLKKCISRSEDAYVSFHCLSAYQTTNYQLSCVIHFQHCLLLLTIVAELSTVQHIYLLTKQML